MRACSWLLILTACAGTSRGAPAAMTNFPENPVCPEPSHPKRSVAASPASRDWHCFDLHRPNEKDLGMCWASSTACKEMQKFVVASNFGTPSACATQKTAYCVDITFLDGNLWQSHCTPRPEDCHESRALVLKEPPDNPHELSTCHPARNVNPFSFMEIEASTHGK